MNTKMYYFVWLAVVAAVLIIAHSQPATAQDALACPTEVGCAEITLSPNTLLGDFFLNEQLLAAGQNHVVLQVPPDQQQQIVIRNLQSPGEVGFNDLFVYQETTLSVNVRAGQIRQYDSSPRKQFIRGTLNHTCDPGSRSEGEDVSCQIIIDGVDRGVFPAGQAAQFNLDPGARLVHVQLVGGQATLWEPNVKEQTANITAGRTSNLTTRFDKRAHLIVSLGTEGMVGDFFINDVQIAAQVPFIDLYVASDVRQVVIRNLQSPGEVGAGFNDLFVYQETTLNVNVGAGQTREYTASPRKQFIRGTLNHTCDPGSRSEGEDVSCQIIIDGVDRGVFPAGQAAQFNLDPGARLVHVQLVGGQATLWEPNVKEQTANITAGRTSNLTTRFDKRAHLIVNLSQEGIVGDFFINDVQIAAQVPFIDLYIASNVRQNVVVRNIQPPQSGYRWLESTGSATVGAGREQTLTIRVQNEPLVTAQQAAALDTMQRGLDNILPVVQIGLSLGHESQSDVIIKTW
jgi:hypothetical protein